VLLFVLACLLATAMPAQAFTLIQGTTKLYVNPNAGYTTSWVQVHATYYLPNACPNPAQTFKFTFDSKLLWSKYVGGCNRTTFLWDTGWSSYIKPPVTPTVGSHKIVVTVYSGSTGLPGGTASFTYRVYQAPASPSPRQSPIPSPSPTPSPIASPSSATCPATGALPPTDTGSLVDNLIAGAMVASVLPIVGFAIFGTSPVLALMRRRRLLKLLGLTLFLTATLSCTSASTPTANVSPVASPSPSASPGCTPS